MKLFDAGTTIAVVLGLMGIFVGVAEFSGNAPRLCDALGGTYTPANATLGKDVCPGGSWLNLVRNRPTPQ